MIVFRAGFIMARIVSRKLMAAVIAVAAKAILSGTSYLGFIFFCCSIARIILFVPKTLTATDNSGLISAKGGIIAAT